MEGYLAVDKDDTKHDDEEQLRVERHASVAVNKQINQIFILSFEDLIPLVKLNKISTFAKRLVP